MTVALLFSVEYQSLALREYRGQSALFHNMPAQIALSCHNWTSAWSLADQPIVHDSTEPVRMVATDIKSESWL